MKNKKSSITWLGDSMPGINAINMMLDLAGNIGRSTYIELMNIVDVNPSMFIEVKYYFLNDVDPYTMPYNTNYTAKSGYFYGEVGQRGCYVKTVFRKKQ